MCPSADQSGGPQPRAESITFGLSQRHQLAHRRLVLAVYGATRTDPNTLQATALVQVFSMNGHSSPAQIRTTLLFCALTALCEGIDLQAAGVAAAGIGAELAPTPDKMANFFSAS